MKSTIFKNCIINLDLGTVKTQKGDKHKRNKGGYHMCRIQDVFGNKYNYIHEIIIAEGLQLPKHLWPKDENGKRFVVDHIIPVSNGGTDAIENLRLIPNADNPKNRLSRVNNSKSKLGKHFSPSTEFKKGQTPWNKGKTYHNNKHCHHTEQARKKMSLASKGKTNAAKQLFQYTLDGILIRIWKSASEAARECGYNQYNISACCHGKRKQSNGYRWSYNRL